MERSENVSDGNADMNANRKSDDSIVPAKRANKTRTLAAEPAEERGSPKGNANQKALPRTQRHNGESIDWNVSGWPTTQATENRAFSGYAMYGAGHRSGIAKPAPSGPSIRHTLKKAAASR